MLDGDYDFANTKITKKNGQFCTKIDEENEKLQDRIKNVDNKTQKNLPTIPITLGEELETNIFLRCEDNKIKNKLEKKINILIKRTFH